MKRCPGAYLGVRRLLTLRLLLKHIQIHVQNSYLYKELVEQTLVVGMICQTSYFILRADLRVDSLWYVFYRGLTHGSFP